MLEQKDLQAIAELIDSRISKTEARFDEKIGVLESKIEKLDKRVGTLEKKVDALDKKVDALDKRVGTLEKNVDALDKKVETLDKRTGLLENAVGTLCKKSDVLEGRISEVENNLINELVRTETILTRRFDKVEKNLEELNEYYRIDKLENGNTALILKTMEEYHKRLKALEAKTA